jgi:MFS family permease
MTGLYVKKLSSVKKWMNMISVVSEKAKARSEASSEKIQDDNFWHLYWDVAWFGVLFGSTISFLAVFAARLGAAGWQLAFFTAGPALISVLFTLPAGRWLDRRDLGSAITKTAFIHRLGYLILVPLPLLLPASIQVWAIMALVLLAAIPGTGLAVGFNAMLAATVPQELRGMVVGRRNAVLAATIMLSFLGSGWILGQLSFEWGYITVFGLGALGAAMSTYHIYRLQVPPVPQFKIRPVGDHAQPGQNQGFAGSAPFRLSVGLRLWLSPPATFRNLSPGYWGMMLAYFSFHFAQFLPGALFTLFWVREARLTDGQIGIINAVFYLAMLIASPLLARFTRRLGNYWLNVVGAVMLGIYPLLTAFSNGMPLLVVASIVGGATWAILSGSLVNRLLEFIPESERPSHLAVYNLALNLAALAGVMLGPLMADVIGLREALFLIALLRIGSGLTLARWG